MLGGRTYVKNMQDKCLNPYTISLALNSLYLMIKKDQKGGIESISINIAEDKKSIVSAIVINFLPLTCEAPMIKNVFHALHYILNRIKNQAPNNILP